MSKITRRTYQLAFIELVRCFVNDAISVDEFKDGLHKIADGYRKDYKNVSS